MSFARFTFGRLSHIPANVKLWESPRLSRGFTAINYVWTRTLGVPSVLVPYANADENNHAPNENLDVDKFYAGIKCTISVLDVLGKTRRVVSIP